MVLRLAAVLHLPLRQQNTLMLAAGYAPIWRESALEAPELASVRQALDFTLAQQEPYPAFVVDRRWNLLLANGGARCFIGSVTDRPPPAPEPVAPIDLADALHAGTSETAALPVAGAAADVRQGGLLSGPRALLE
jgi:MmyB-like transcription regulator ligand binding domain